MAVQVKARVTEQDLLALGEDVRAEVVDGEIVIDMAPNRIDHPIIGMQLGNFLSTFVKTHKLGWVGGDMGTFKLKPDPEGGIKGARVPDLFYISYTRLPPDANLGIVPDFAPDLAVEIVSETETMEAVLKKTYDFLDHGAAQVWLVIPALREVRVFTPSNRAGLVFAESDTLPGGDLLPGFAIPVQAIFDTTDAEMYARTLRELMA